MSNYLFHRAERRRRNTALFITLVIHLALLAGLAATGSGEWRRYLPETVQHWLGVDSAEVSGPVAPRP